MTRYARFSLYDHMADGYFLQGDILAHGTTDDLKVHMGCCPLPRIIARLGFQRSIAIHYDSTNFPSTS
jgi:hypothetical protein